MDKKFRIIIGGLICLAAIFTLIGAIGLLAVCGTIGGAMNGNISSYMDAVSAVAMVKSIPVFHDFLRFGAFSIFLLSCVQLAAEFVSEGKVKNFTLIAAGSSVLGFVGVFISSSLELLGSIGAVIIVGSIFGLLSALAAVAFFIIGFIKKKAPLPDYGYGYPAQQPYPQQEMNTQPIYSQQVQPTYQQSTYQQPVQQPVYQQSAPMQQPVPQEQPAPAAGAPWICSCGMTNQPDSKFCFNCGKPRQ